MHGDLSTPFTTRDINFAGILEQQGRVSLDADANAATAIALAWQDTEASDVIGSGVAAVPADAPNSFFVTKAAVDVAGNVLITVSGGRVWVDGILVQLEGTAPITRKATYLQPPVAAPPAAIVANTRDAIVLEVYREALSSFQRPDLLIEPALGGPDTIERIHTSFDFRLLRLIAGDDCGDLAAKLDDNLAAKGHLTVSLLPTTVVPGPCPVNDAGGYTGFEHALYRIEIANVAGAPQFKWSQFNGGLVGRADFQAGLATILSNLQPIVTSGLSNFYLEALAPDTDGAGLPIFDRWRVSYGADVTLNANDELVLGLPIFGAAPNGPTFFRLWNELRACSDFPTGGAPVELVDGVCLAFDPDAVGAYTPGDYWTFDVRAGNIEIDPHIVGGVRVLIDDAPPEGIRSHRVPLGIVTWHGLPDLAGVVSDCREVFQPLTRLDTCCTYRVGDGVHSHGQFTSIQDAVNHLPPTTGGKICVLPGRYDEHVSIDTLHDIVISGCGKRSRVVGDTADPVFHIRDSQRITIEQLRIDARDDAIGVLVDTNAGENRDVLLKALIVHAATRSAIEVRGGVGVTIRDSSIGMADDATSWPAIFFIAKDGLIERNVIRVLAFAPIDEGVRVDAGAGLGGIQLGGTCERVHVVENLIQGGNGRGITLGSITRIDDHGADTGIKVGWPTGVNDPCFPCAPGDGYIPGDGGGEGTHEVSAGPLYEIYIERNRILDMGLDGIGVIGFWDLTVTHELISVERLTIVGNEIRFCMRRELAPILAAMRESMGYGGVALADVEYLRAHHNVIEDNGPDHVQPVCGIFVLHGVGLDISDNHIRNNGARNEAQPVNAAKDGPRGGIIIVYAVVPPLFVGVPDLKSHMPAVPVQNGVPALRVHDNVVNAPLGRALSVTALGPVSVQGNALGTHGIVAGRDVVEPDLLAATVFILDLGRSHDIDLQLPLFMLLGAVAPSADVVTQSNDTLVINRVGVDGPVVGGALVDGRVLFNDNQVELDLSETGMMLALTSIMILSLDDVSCEDNQCVCTLFGDIVLAHAVVLGLSLRVHGNRFAEGLLLSIFSAITYGAANSTVHNQATRCIVALGPVPNLVRTPNTVLHPNAYCQELAKGPDLMYQEVAVQ